MAKEWRDDVTPDEEVQEAERKRQEELANPENEEAVEAAKERVENYVHSNVVQGYGRSDDGYGGPYHPDAFHDPQIKFALGGAPEAQADYTKELYEADKARADDGEGIDKVDLVAASAHSTVVEEQPYRAAAETIEVEATHDNVEEAAARKHFITPRSDESNDDAISRVLANDKAAAPAKDASDAPERNTAGTEEEDANSPGDGDKTGSNAPAKKSAPAKKTAAKKTTSSRKPAKKATSRRQPKFDDK